ncbi:hypothetical protein MSPP1_003031 [Malassezia sp. CBS 17886]|nr:hypothetical protein MSPP1_003031 [Malassezia sp. CBS 17886]
MQFDELCVQEPPQARLLRLRGLFDTLLDSDPSSALAGGRAKQAWRRTASRARYGAGGSLATGSLVGREVPPRGDGDAPAPDGAQSKSPSQYLLEWFALVRRQSYAKELLDKCRASHAELERVHADLAASAAKNPDRRSALRSWFGLGGRAEPLDDDGRASRSWLSLLRFDEPTRRGDAEDASAGPYAARRTRLLHGSGANHSLLMSFESGWKGSRVWGLKAMDDDRGANARSDTHASPTSGAPKQNAQRARQRQIDWEGFLAYAEIQERALHKLFNDIDTNHDGVLDPTEIRAAFDRAGLHLSADVLKDFIASLASSGVADVAELHSNNLFVTFPEFRDYLLLMPRKPTMGDVYHFYQVRKAVGLFGNEGIFASLGAGWGRTERGASAVNLDGDVNLAGEERLTQDAAHASHADGRAAKEGAERTPYAPVAPPPTGAKKDEEEEGDAIRGSTAAKFLLAGGIAGAVSRTATAPFDRLKVYLITAQPAAAQAPGQPSRSTVGSLVQSIGAIYREGGLRGFWLGNGLNCVKIFPESAIKFLTYETSKRMFAKHVDHVSDSRDISGFSRFMSGGIGGITSQFAIYPIETLKTRLMSSQTATNTTRGFALLSETARAMWTHGGTRAYYRGLSAGLIGVFPYSAIDMSTFEGIKLFYCRYTHKEEPGVLALLGFGSVSGSVGATTVYPLNLIRTRLQASGTPAHPVVYTSFMDAAVKTYQREGVLGFYRGLVPTLAKVVPAVSISYVVYEQCKRRLGVE